MMWLGRADTAFDILPPDRESGIVSDSPRELRDAVLVTNLLQSTGTIERLKQINGILELMVGESDNLTVPQMLELLAKQNISNISDLSSSRDVEAFQDELRKGDLGTQQIRSQVILSDPKDLYQVPPPSTFQLFGQRFAIDSFVLSKVVYDSIIYRGEKVRRHMPSGADVMVALGNDAALPILRPEMESLPYASNLQASRDFVSQFRPSYWQRNLYSIWLDALRPLSADRSSEKRFPEAMRTAAWQMKQLQTQLASWLAIPLSQSYAIAAWHLTPGCALGFHIRPFQGRLIFPISLQAIAHYRSRTNRGSASNGDPLQEMWKIAPFIRIEPHSATIDDVRASASCLDQSGDT
jgi:hypothetical protein